MCSYKKNNMKAISRSILILILFMQSAIANAAQQPTYMNQSTIKDAVNRYLKARLQIQPSETLNIRVSQLDSRLKLAKCPAGALEVFSPIQDLYKKALTLGVRCQTEQAYWNIYVPVTVSIMVDAVVARSNIGKGTRLNSGNVMITKINKLTQRYAHFTGLKNVKGLVLNKNLRAGQVINSKSVSLPIIVRKGQKVSIAARSGNIQVTMKGIAKQSGRLNDYIQVMNLSSKKIVQGKILKPGEIGVGM